MGLRYRYGRPVGELDLMSRSPSLKIYIEPKGHQTNAISYHILVLSCSQNMDVTSIIYQRRFRNFGLFARTIKCEYEMWIISSKVDMPCRWRFMWPPRAWDLQNLSEQNRHSYTFPLSSFPSLLPFFFLGPNYQKKKSH